MRTTLIFISNPQAKGEKDYTTKCQNYFTDMGMKHNQTSDIKLK